MEVVKGKCYFQGKDFVAEVKKIGATTLSIMTFSITTLDRLMAFSITINKMQDLA
jgi:hypothetical protein